MAYSNHRLRLANENFAADGISIWEYSDTVAAASILSSYIADGYSRRMRVGDLLVYRQWASIDGNDNGTGAITAVSIHPVTGVDNDTGYATIGAAIDGTSSVLLVTSATGTPSANDDVGDGYAVGAIWVETDVDIAYICVDNSSAAAIWVPINSQVVVPILGVGLNGTTAKYAIAPFKFAIKKIYTVVEGATTADGNATVQIAIGGSDVTNGLVTIASGSTVGTMDEATPSAANTGAAGAVLRATPDDNSQSAAATANVYMLLQQVP
jgi:hypothetical protein